jgi:hypothetical protein
MLSTRASSQSSPLQVEEGSFPPEDKEAVMIDSWALEHVREQKSPYSQARRDKRQTKDGEETPKRQTRDKQETNRRHRHTCMFGR